MDLVYPLGTGTVWEDNELRYSLRSVEENLNGVRNIYIIGQKPAWLKNVIHLEHPDNSGVKSKNTYLKYRLVCQQPDLSDNWLMMNDDFFINEPAIASEWPYFYKGELPTAIAKSKLFLQEAPMNTVRYLQMKKLGMKDYRVHCPMIINKEKFLQMPIAENEFGIVNTRAVYGNFYQVGGILTKERFLSGGKTVPEIAKRMSKHPYFSLISMAAKNWAVRRYLEQRWPKPSRYEKDL